MKWHQSLGLEAMAIIRVDKRSSSKLISPRESKVGLNAL
jgi:hypothetical protein